MVGKTELFRIPESWADLATKVREGAISEIFGSQVSLKVKITPWEMKNTLQHYCDKTIDGKMALNCECCFGNCTNHYFCRF